MRRRPRFVPDGRALVGGEVVHDHDVAGLQGQGEHLLDIGQEPGPSHGAVEHHRGGHARQPQGPDERGLLPVTLRHAAPQLLAARRTPMSAGHLGGSSSLIDEYEPFGIEIELTVEPCLPAAQDVGTALLVRVCRLFLSVIRRRTKNRHRLDRLVPTPCSARAARNSAKVMSVLRSTRPRIKSAWPSIRPERRSPPRGPGRMSPCDGTTFRPQSRRSHDRANLPKAPCSFTPATAPSMKVESEPGPLGDPRRFNQVAKGSRVFSIFHR